MARRFRHPTAKQLAKAFRYHHVMRMPDAGLSYRLDQMRAVLSEVAPGRHAQWRQQQWGHEDYIIGFSIEAERDQFALWVELSGIDWTTPGNQLKRAPVVHGPVRVKLAKPRPEIVAMVPDAIRSGLAWNVLDWFARRERGGMGYVTCLDQASVRLRQLRPSLGDQDARDLTIQFIRWVEREHPDWWAKAITKG